MVVPARRRGLQQRSVKMASPRISILINNFNYAQFLGNCIDSALAQTYPGVEVIVVDDCSTDNSRDVLAKYAGQIRTVVHARNAGQGAAINSGFRVSSGEIIMLLDADDLLYRNAAAGVVRWWVPGCSKMQYRLDLMDASGAKVDVYPPPEIRFDSTDVIPRLLNKGRYETTVTSGSSFSRAALQSVLPIPEEEFRISADGYLAVVTPFYGAVISIESPLGVYRQHGFNAWSANTLPQLGSHLRRSLLHDERKYKALSERAQQHGLTAMANPGLRDHQHIETRLASLRLEPNMHPYPRDSRVRLALQGVAASCSARTTAARRTVLAGWFLAVGLSPTALARHAIAWRLAPFARPRHVGRLLKVIRRLTS